jgi:hypothetical protein
MCERPTRAIRALSTDRNRAGEREAFRLAGLPWSARICGLT